MSHEPEEIRYILSRLPQTPEEFRLLALKNLSRIFGQIEVVGAGYGFSENARLDAAINNLLDAVQEAPIEFNSSERTTVLKMLNEALPTDAAVESFLAGLRG